MEINLTIDRFEENKAVLKTEDGKEIIIFPKNLLPAGVLEGAVLNFSIRALAEAEEEKRKKAKDILNEILNIGDNNG